MVQIILTNQNPKFSMQTVTIDILSRQCLFSDNNHKFQLQELYAKSDFIHPLLSEPYSAINNYYFHYEYSTLDELFYAAIYVYSILIHVDNPAACVFKLTPTKDFSNHQDNDAIYFSIHPNKKALEIITIEQLNKLLNQILGMPFKYTDTILIDDTFTVKDLPPSVNGDLLYSYDKELIKFLKQATDLNRFELRYIKPGIDFGLYSKTLIKKGEILALYTGIKTVRKPTDLCYTFLPRNDTLNLYTDAKFLGNITRFINHAPDAKKNEQWDANSLLSANCIALPLSIHGIELCLFQAKTDILPGEQILCDYGTKFFSDSKPLRFKKNGQIYAKFKKNRINLTRYKIIHYRIMANCGVRAAQKYLLIRLLMIFLVVFVVVFIFNNWNTKPFE
ncbi:TPA: SET domain-containing protein [Legionella pneumophila]|nr:SET domain-containing protein [Legionella pneumophila]